MGEYRVIYEYKNKNELSGPTVTDSFSSNEDEIKVMLSGVSDGEICAAIFSRDKNGVEMEVFSKCFFGGEFSLERSFDPISLAVYTGAVSFFVAVESKGSYRLNKLVAEEIVEAVSADELRTTEKNEIAIKKEIPDHVLFVGNSLVFGMGKRYGMCASAPDKDYFHYVTEYIKKYNPVCSFDKLYGSMFEHAETMEAFEHWYHTDCEVYPDKAIAASLSFTADLDLILLQLADNINTDEKVENFVKTKDVLIERIKASCPKARIIWIHGWYNKARTDCHIKALCERWGLERIDISSVRSHETEAHTQKYYLDAKDGVIKEVSERWITHPGDLGMKKIADLIIEKLGF